jgi:nitroreductase
MDFFDVIERRQSIRAFAANDIEPAKVERILTALCLAPSAGNLQAFLVVLVREQERRRLLDEAAYGRGFLAQAPIVLAFLADQHRSETKYGRRGATLFCIQDATIAAAYAQLAATALGIASCWVGAFDEARVATILGTPPHLRPVALMPLGYPAEAPERRHRRPLSELMRHEQL